MRNLEIARAAALGQGLAVACALGGCVDLGLPTMASKDGAPVATDGGPPAADGNMPAAKLLAPLPDQPAPTNLARVVVVFPAPLPVIDLALVDEAGNDLGALPRLPPPDDPVCAGQLDGACVSLELAAGLAPNATYHVALGPSLPDVGGAGALHFTTGATADGVPPTGSFTVAQSDGCVVVRVIASEPVWARLAADPTGAGGGRYEVAPGLAVTAELAHSFAGDPPSTAYDLTVVLTDLAGNTALLAPDGVTSDAEPPGWALTEVLANAVGPEPRQEWIEIERTGDGAASLAGMSISDGTGDDLLPDVMVEPGTRALIVPLGYDASAPGDTPPAPGTVLARLDNDTIGAGGLANHGETVTLRDASGVVVSTFTSYFDVSATSWAGRSVERIYPGACDVRTNAAPNKNHAATPGAKNSVEP